MVWEFGSLAWFGVSFSGSRTGTAFRPIDVSLGFGATQGTTSQHVNIKYHSGRPATTMSLVTRGSSSADSPMTGPEN